MRGAQDTIPQRQLVYELSLAIDLARIAPKTGRRTLDRLLAENPRSSWSTHVLHNIGARRRAWLEEHVRAAGASTS